MFYEDYKIKRGDTLWNLAGAYGYRNQDWKKIWDDPANAGLVAKRKKPELCRPGDLLMIPIPWTVQTWSLAARTTPDPTGGPTLYGAEMDMERDGELGKQLTFVQTVYRHNQPIGPNPNPFCVDGCIPDDELPFYYTNAELSSVPNRRKHFNDHSRRPAPSAATGTTKWRAVVSVAVVTEKRVSIWDSTVWGWDLTPAASVSIIGPRDATDFEISGHLQLLKTGLGTGPLDFGKLGWTFRKAV